MRKLGPSRRELKRVGLAAIIVIAQLAGIHASNPFNSKNRNIYIHNPKCILGVLCGFTLCDKDYQIQVASHLTYCETSPTRKIDLKEFRAVRIAGVPSTQERLCSFTPIPDGKVEQIKYKTRFNLLPGARTNAHSLKSCSPIID
ncbi:hypothetical protein ACJJTC_005676 [Scirpophaga incertulas]